MNNTISIIIPCFNYGHFLPETLNSVLLQSYNNWECLVIDDGSTDNTREVADFYRNKDSRIKYFYQENRGLSSARNHGLEVSSGDFIQFLDADDLLEERKIELQLKFLSVNPNIDIVYGSMIRFDSDIKVLTGNDSWMLKVSGRGYEILNFLIVKNIMVVCAPLIRKKVINKTGDFNTNLKSVEDWEYWIRCALNNFSFYYLDESNTKVLIRSHTKSMMENTTVMNSNFINVRKIIMDKLPSILRKTNQKLLIELYGEIALSSIQTNEHFKALKYLFRINHLKFFYYLYHCIYWWKTNIIKSVKNEKR